MHLYKIKIKPLSSFESQLQSDTLFGAFCWSYRYLYGEGELGEFLKDNTDEPQLIFSNAFLSGCLPLPMGSYDEDRTNKTAQDKTSAKSAYQDNKKLKKCTLIEETAFRNIQKGKRTGYSEYLCEDKIQQVEVTHNMVGRDTGTVTKSDDGSGNLFVRDEFYVEKDILFDIYILTSMNLSVIQKVLSLMFELGIGANKSSGKGHFELEPYKNGEFLEEEPELLEVEGANSFVALSNFIPDTEDPTEGWYKTLVKYGKLDREFAAGQYPFKKPLLFIQAGAVFQTDTVKEYYGKFITNVAAVNEDIVVNAYTIALPMYVPEEIKR